MLKDNTLNQKSLQIAITNNKLSNLEVTHDMIEKLKNSLESTKKATCIKSIFKVLIEES